MPKNVNPLQAIYIQQSQDIFNMQGRQNSLGELQEDQILWNPKSNKDDHLKSNHKIDIIEVFSAHKLFSKNETIISTPITHNKALSDIYKAEIFMKREDLQRAKTCKIRGAYYYFLKNEDLIRKKGFVAVSDGNFATAVALLSGMYKFKCTIYIPYVCFQHKIELIKRYGKEFVTIVQEGDDFEECQAIAKKYAQENQIPFVSPHSSLDLMPGYATIAKEIMEQKSCGQIHYVLIPSGGGALVSSLASFIKQVLPNTKVIAVEPQICTPFANSVVEGKPVASEKVSKYCNGSSVKSIGESCFDMGKTCIDGFVSVSENKLAQTVIRLYSLGYICEPSGALGVAALNKMRNEIAGKNVLCLLTGSNMDLLRLEQSRQLNVISKGYKNFYKVEIPNKKRALFELIVKCFKKTDVISVRFAKKGTADTNYAFLAVQSPSQENVQYALNQMIENKYKVQTLTDSPEVFELIF